MADQPAKRRVKDPETFRQRALKAAEEGDKPKARLRVKAAGGRVTAPVTGSISKVAQRLGRYRFFRILGKILFPPYLRKSWQELRLVQWPSWSESRRLTVAVLIFAIIFGITIAGVDYVLDKLFKALILGK